MSDRPNKAIHHKRSCFTPIYEKSLLLESFSESPENGGVEAIPPAVIKRYHSLHYSIIPLVVTKSHRLFGSNNIRIQFIGSHTLT